MKVKLPVTEIDTVIFPKKSFYSISTYMFIQAQASLIPKELSQARFDFLAITNLKLFLYDEYQKDIYSKPILKDDYSPDIESFKNFIADSFNQLSFLDFQFEIVDQVLNLYISPVDEDKCDMETIKIEYDLFGDGMRTLISSLAHASGSQSTEEEFKKIIIEGICRELLKCVSPPPMIQI